MIINQMALDRGFAHGSIFKTELIETKVYKNFTIFHFNVKTNVNVMLSLIHISYVTQI